MKGERLMTTTDTLPRAAEATRTALQPIDWAEMETVEGGSLLSLLWQLLTQGFIGPIVG
jgi:hypothetical protein